MDSTFTYSLSGGNATITGLVDTTMTGQLVIPSTIDTDAYPVVGIGDSAFSGCTGLTSVTIPDSVTSIGRSAFRECSNLTILTIPNSVTSIGDVAFYNCSGLTSITILSSLTSIGASVFQSCSSLTNVTIPSSVTSIGDWAFAFCSGLTSVTIPSSVTSIGDWTFYNCSGLTSMTIPNGVTSIGESVFQGCSGLTSVTIPASMTSIGTNAFAYCTALTSVYIDDLVAWLQISFPRDTNNPLSFAHNLYLGGERIEDLIIPDTVTSIGQYAFVGGSCITSVIIPDSVTSIGDSAFFKCSGLNNVVIGSSVSAIGTSAFADCSNLTYVKMSPSDASNVTIMSNAFADIAPNAVVLISTDAVNYDSGAGTWQGLPIAFYDITVLLDQQGGTGGLANVTVSYGSAMPLIESENLPQKDEAIFVGYYSEPNGQGTKYYNDDGTSAKVFDTIGVKSTNLYAYWVSATTIFSVTLNANGGAINAGNVTEYTYGVGATLPTDVTNTGYQFLGWYESPDFTGPRVYAISATDSGNKTYYAKWGFEVVFKDWDGTTLKTEDVLPGDSATAPAEPSREGYTFSGWDSDDYLFVTSNLTITAIYIANQYTVTFDAQGGSVAPPSKVVTYDSPYGSIPTPIRDGSNFIGWFTAETGGTQITAASSAHILNNQILYAHWTNNSYPLTMTRGKGIEKIYYRIGGLGDFTQSTESPQTIFVEYGVPWYAYAEPAIGYSYTDTSAETPETSTMGSDGAFFVPVGTPKTYNIILNPNGGEYNGTTEQSTIENALTFDSSNSNSIGTATKEGVVFAGWYDISDDSDVNGNLIWDEHGNAVNGQYWRGSGKSAVYVHDGNITAYAHYAEKQTITFVSGIPYDTSITKEYAIDAIYGKLPIPVKEGYSFLGWFTSDMGGDQVSENDVVPQMASRTLYAHWVINISGPGISLLNNEVENTEVILWQYDKAWNLIHLIENWNKLAKAASQDFWDRFWGFTNDYVHGTFFIDYADTFGLNVWGNMLGISRPRINYEGYSGFISNDLYRRLLKARFFMYNHKPTVPNYNKFLTILWGALDSENGNAIEYDTTKIFNEEGVANYQSEDDSDSDSDSDVQSPQYRSRCEVFDFQNMTMGFSFPQNATDEEAYLIFQHYDIIYPFPAGIRYPGEFILDDLVIGLNETQATGQNYRNFVDGVILAEDNEPFSSTTGIAQNTNGGIFSTTDRANYSERTKIQGMAFVFNAPSSDAEVTITVATTQPVPIWIDWGDGDCLYYKVFPATNTRTHKYNAMLSGKLIAVRVISNHQIGEITIDPTSAKAFRLAVE